MKGKSPEKENFYQAVVQQAVEAVYLFDPVTRKVIEANSSFLKLLGYSAKEAENLSVYDFIAHCRKNIDKNIQNVLKFGRAAVGERLWQKKYGSLVDVELTAGKIRR